MREVKRSPCSLPVSSRQASWSNVPKQSHPLGGTPPQEPTDNSNLRATLQNNWAAVFQDTNIMKGKEHLRSQVQGAFRDLTPELSWWGTPPSQTLPGGGGVLKSMLQGVTGKLSHGRRIVN